MHMVNFKGDLAIFDDCKDFYSFSTMAMPSDIIDFEYYDDNKQHIRMCSSAWSSLLAEMTYSC